MLDNHDTERFIMLINSDINRKKKLETIVEIDSKHYEYLLECEKCYKLLLQIFDVDCDDVEDDD